MSGNLVLLDADYFKNNLERLLELRNALVRENLTDAIVMKWDSNNFRAWMMRFWKRFWTKTELTYFKDYILDVGIETLRDGPLHKLNDPLALAIFLAK